MKEEENEFPYEPSPDIELNFVILKYREGFRFFQGVLIPGKNPIIFQVEQASAYARNAEELAIRLQIKRILGESQSEIMMDLILSEPSLFEVPKKSLRMREEQPPQVKQDKVSEIMVSYRESLSSLPKMDDLALDLHTVEAQKI